MGKAQRVGSRYNEDVDDVDDDPDERQGSQQEDQDTGSDNQQEQDQGSEQDEQETRPSKREAKYRRQRNEARTELRRLKAELDSKREDRRAREELAFVKAAAAAGVTDVEAAWKLADREMLQWEQEGDDDPPQLTGVEEAVAKVLDRYPYVASGQSDRSRTTDDDDDDRVRPPSATTSGRATNGPKPKPKELDRAYLERKFPALQKRGSHRGFGG